MFPQRPEQALFQAKTLAEEQVRRTKFSMNSCFCVMTAFFCHFVKEKKISSNKKETRVTPWKDKLGWPDVQKQQDEL